MLRRDQRQKSRCPADNLLIICWIFPVFVYRRTLWSVIQRPRCLTLAWSRSLPLRSSAAPPCRVWSGWRASRFNISPASTKKILYWAASNGKSLCPRDFNSLTRWWIRGPKNSPPLLFRITVLSNAPTLSGFASKNFGRWPHTIGTVFLPPFTGNTQPFPRGNHDHRHPMANQPWQGKAGRGRPLLPPPLQGPTTVNQLTTQAGELVLYCRH